MDQGICCLDCWDTDQSKVAIAANGRCPFCNGVKAVAFASTETPGTVHVHIPRDRMGEDFTLTIVVS